MMLLEIYKKIAFDKKTDRIGPDIPFTHWRLFLKSRMRKLCKKKFLFFGEGSEFRPHAYAINCSKIKIGENVVIRPGSMLFADIREKEFGIIDIKDNVLIGSGVHIYTSNHEFKDLSKGIIDQGHSSPKNVILHEGCWIGANSLLLPGVEIGFHSIIGAGSVVTKNIPPYTIAAGNPARVIKKLM